MTRHVLPVITLASIDHVARGSAVAGVLCDAPGAVVVQYDVHPLTAPGTDHWADVPDRSGAVLLRRLVLSAAGVLESQDVELEHGCLSCAIREDVLPTLHRLCDHLADWSPGRDPMLLLALPVAAEPLPVVRAIRAAATRRPGRLRTAAVVTAADAQTFEEDLLGDETLAERGLALFADDQRSVGEALAHQVDVSDVLATTAPLDARSTRLLAHLGTPPVSIMSAPLDDLRPRRLARYLRPGRDTRGDLQLAQPSGACDGEGVWTLDLTSVRPLHPGRVLERIEDLGSGRLRSRGHLRLASRPHTAVAWDGAGGQLSVGSLGPWTRPTPSTRIVVTGTDPAERARVARAFEGLALTDAEYALGADWWAGRGDDLNPWLGDPAELLDLDSALELGAPLELGSESSDRR